MLNKKATLRDVALFLFIVPISVTRLSKSDSTFPPLEKIGRSIFIDRTLFFKWLSVKAGKTITSSNKLMTGKHLQDYFQKSPTWIWQQVKAGSLPKPFKINRTNYWLERDIIDDREEAA